jgi:hypothetical protein
MVDDWMTDILQLKRCVLSYGGLVAWVSVQDSEVWDVVESVMILNELDSKTTNQ